MNAATHTPRTDRLLAWVLRLVGAMEFLAFGAAMMPRAWMEAQHAWLGLGGLPPGPVFEAVMRQVSFTYGLHGIGMWLIASDLQRYRPFVVLTTLGYLVAAPAFFAIDTAVGMPPLYVAGNGGSCLVVGALLTVLLVAGRRRAAPSAKLKPGTETAQNVS